MKFWAYQHIDGKIHVKRFTTHSREEIDQAFLNPDIKEVLSGINAENRKEAEQKAIAFFRSDGAELE